VTRHIEAERLSAWISGELGERDVAVVRIHVEACTSCAQTESELRAQVLVTRSLDRPEPPPTLWPAIEGALDALESRPWSWRSSLAGAFAGGAIVVAAVLGILYVRGGRGPQHVPSPARVAEVQTPRPVEDPLLVEAESELRRAAESYEQAVSRLRKILEREQALWDPETRARVGDRLARLDEAVIHSRAVARRDPSDSSGADMLFSAYRRQIDFLAEAVHRGSPAAGEGLR
jgi:hypothetical protein